MASPTYACSGIVLKKTKLNESDLIITLLADDGSQKRVVAKGARKPTSSFSSRMELFSECRLLCAQGKNLDIVSEARLIEPHAALRSSMERSVAAAPCVELLAKITQPSLPYIKLFDATAAGLSAFEKAPEHVSPAITAAMLVKTLGLSGFRPALTACLMCGRALDTQQQTAKFSPLDGGYVCNDCAHLCETITVDTSTLQWLAFQLSSPYQDILNDLPNNEQSFRMLRLLETLIRTHIGSGLKSLNFLFTSGLYE